jgi:hypothetical protein
MVQLRSFGLTSRTSYFSYCSRDKDLNGSNTGHGGINVGIVTTYKDRLYGGISVRLKFKLFDSK